MARTKQTVRKPHVICDPCAEALSRISATQAAHYRAYLAKQVRAQTVVLKALELNVAAAAVSDVVVQNAQ